ncbi:MAG: DUF4194 domain-containing protein [bacterium]|nr:DUF4194 domain-containing protein [bacterium]
MTLWQGDTGTLHEDSRRALLELLKGPYLSSQKSPNIWAALVADEPALRSRLHDLFLELVIDPAAEIAFTRKVRTTEINVPSALRSEQLSFIDTAMLLVLRQLLLASPGERRVIVGKEEVFERLAVYSTGDDSVFARNLNAAWGRMTDRLRVLHPAGEGRAEISPAVRFLIDEERARALTSVYSSLSSPDDAPSPSAPTPPSEIPIADDGAPVVRPEPSAGSGDEGGRP